MNASGNDSGTSAIFNNLPYAETPQRMLHLDLRVPRSKRPAPLIMYIPVGGMRVCSKEYTPWWLTEYGFAMAAIEVRVSPEVIAPVIVHDCKAGVRWLRAHAAQYGYAPDRIGAWGHSAGGNLAALLGTSGGVAELEGDSRHAAVSSRVQAVCDECGAPHDFTWFARSEIKTKFAGVAENIRIYLGGSVEERPNLARLVSPQTYVSGNCPPMLLLHGDSDAVVPVEETVSFHRALRAVGGDATLRILPGVGHGWDAALTRDEVAAFFDRTLR